LTERWSVDLEPVTDPGRLAPLWLDLQARARVSFFQSWGWVGSWLRALPTDLTPRLLIAREGGRITALGVLGAAAVRRRRLVRSRQLLVGESGRRDLDTLTVEHSGLLLERGREAEALRKVLACLAADQPRWDELVVSGVDAPDSGLYAEAARAAGLWPRTVLRKPSFYADLQAVRDSGGDYLSALTPNTRRQVRQALRGYARSGPVRLREAASLEEARAFLDALAELHQARWRARGEPGAFGSAFARSFHQELLAACFERGEVQLAGVFAGGETVGYVYNFVCRGVGSNYQGGFVYGPEAWRRPGLVIHSLVAQRGLERGWSRYDLLMGDQRYKRSLTTHQEELVWLRLQHPRLRFWLERFAEEFAERLRRR
jgi:CelD/BcsL family acetyltransferase involved in cellulose biosynthesis